MPVHSFKIVYYFVLWYCGIAKAVRIYCWRSMLWTQCRYLWAFGRLYRCSSTIAAPGSPVCFGLPRAAAGATNPHVTRVADATRTARCGRIAWLPRLYVTRASSRAAGRECVMKADVIRPQGLANSTSHRPATKCPAGQQPSVHSPPCSLALYSFTNSHWRLFASTPGVLRTSVHSNSFHFPGPTSRTTPHHVTL